MALRLTSPLIPHPRLPSAVKRTAVLFFLAPAVFGSGCAPAPAQIIELDPAHGSVGVRADAPMTVTFDQPVRPASLNGLLQISPGIPNCDMGKVFANSTSMPCYVQWGPNNRSFTVVHTNAPYSPQVHYTYVLSAGIQSTQGVVNPLEHRWEVTGEIATSVVATNPSEGGTVAIDSPLVVSFSRDMLPETSSSISLSPAIPGTTVVQNTQDLGRFVVLTGGFLQVGTTYTLSVTTEAIDAHHQHIAVPDAVHFHAVTTSGRRALLLLGPSGGPATQIVVSPLASHTLGDPVAQFQLLPINASGYQEAALSPSGAQLAVIGSFGLEVMTLQTGRMVSPPGPAPQLISWAPDSSRLAYAASDGEHVFSPADGSDQLVAAGLKVGTVAQWARDSASMLLLATDTTGTHHLEIAEIGVDLHYAVPGVTGDVSTAAFAGDGSAIAYDAAGSLWYERLNNFTPKTLGPLLTPLGFDSNGAVVAISPPNQQLIHVDPSNNTRTTTDLAPNGAQPTSVSGSSDWRQLCLLAQSSPAFGATMQAFVENADGSGVTQLTFVVAPATVLGAQFVG